MNGTHRFLRYVRVCRVHETNLADKPNFADLLDDDNPHPCYAETRRCATFRSGVITDVSDRLLLFISPCDYNRSRKVQVQQVRKKITSVLPRRYSRERFDTRKTLEVYYLKLSSHRTRLIHFFTLNNNETMQI